MRPFVAAIVGTTIALAAPAHATADEDAVRAAGREWVTRYKAGDIEGLMKLYAPDAEVALHGQPKLTGSAAIRGYFTPRLARKPDADFLLAEESLRVTGNQAISMAKYWLTLRLPGGRVVQDAGRSLIVYTRGKDRRWRILIDIDQAAPDVAFPPAADAR